MQPDKPQRGGCGPLAIVLALALVLGPPLYVLSIGPATWLCWHGYISDNTCNLYIHPAEFAFQACGQDRALQSYQELFEPLADIQ